MTLASIVYATWHYGAVHSSCLRNLSLSLGAAVILAMSCRQTYQIAPKRLPVLFFALILTWIGYAWLQRTTIAGWLPAPFHGVVEIREQWGTESITLLTDAITTLNEIDVDIPVGQFASLIPEETRQALVPFLLGCAVAVLSALLFNTARSRRIFLWTLIVNAGALACWGIIQSSGGGEQILPGVRNTFSSGMPFSSFIYKNAGAAALLPALCGIAAMLYGRSSHRDSGPSSGSYRQNLSSRSILLDATNLTLIGFALLLVVGLAASLSRGAWITAVVAALVVWQQSRFAIHKREHLVFGVVAGLAILAVIALVGIKQDIRGRAGQISLDYVSTDSRWPQWVDGFSTALAHLPSGSGLGTYGYATLPHQTSARRAWFREAHNQYLEVFTESGLIGITLLSVGIGWFAVISFRLMRARNDREVKSWGLLGIALLVCGGVQSIFDFVLVIPANLFLYAGLIGIIGAVARTTAHQRDSSDRKGDNRQNIFARYAQLPAGWCGIAACCLVLAFVASNQQISSERTLERTSVTQLDEEPSEAQVLASIRTLDRAIERQPQQASLYQRRSNWHLAAYRLDVAAAVRREGMEVAWPHTRPENLFALVLSQSHESRGALLALLLGTPRMKSRLVDVLADLSCALSLNPLSPQEHLNCCALAPVVGMPTKPWLVSSAALNNNSCDLLYLNGLFAFYSDELDLAVDQWSKSLAIHHKYLESIFQLSQQKLPAMRIVTDLVPSSRTDLYVRLIRSTGRDLGDPDRTLYDGALAKAMVGHLENRDAIESGRKHATIAQIWQLLGDHDSALLSWEQALKANAHDAGYRLEYSQSLSRLGRNDEALKQAVLGQTLNPVDKRFERLTARIRQQIRAGSRR